MLFLFLAIAIPANMLGIAALAYGLRGRSASVATVLAMLTLLAAATTASLAVFETAAIGRLADSRLFEAENAEAEEVRALKDRTVDQLRILGFAGTVLPFVGAVVCFVRARRLDD